MTSAVTTGAVAYNSPFHEQAEPGQRRRSTRGASAGQRTRITVVDQPINRQRVVGDRDRLMLSARLTTRALAGEEGVVQVQDTNDVAGALGGAQQQPT